jgi:hypothetical protein
MKSITQAETIQMMPVKKMPINAFDVAFIPVLDP